MKANPNPSSSSGDGVVNRDDGGSGERLERVLSLSDHVSFGHSRPQGYLYPYQHPTLLTPLLVS